MFLTLPQTALIGIVYLGAFSRFTHGQYTPLFYQYQLDRAPDNDSTRLIPVADVILGTLLLFPRTRMWAALLCALGQGGGIVKRLQEGQTIAPDLALFSLAVVVLITSRSRR